MTHQSEPPLTESPLTAVTHRAVSLASRIINCQSVTPDDDSAQDILINELSGYDFKIIRDETAGVKSFFAVCGERGPLVVFSGHTDVVPATNPEKWTTPPFSATVRNGCLFGRGAVDMKGADAAMVVATLQFLEVNPSPPFRIGLLFTGDEETNSIGITAMLNVLTDRSIKIDFALVGEPTSANQLGDTVKVGRRGSYQIALTIEGKSGHVAYPQYAENAAHRFASALSQMCATIWDTTEITPGFDATTFQTTYLHSDGGAGNVIPGTLEFRGNWRHPPSTTREMIEKTVRRILDQHKLNYSLRSSIGAEPFTASAGKVSRWISAAIAKELHRTPHLSSSGGTSDARFLAAHGADLAEFGLVGLTAHQVDEHTEIVDLVALTQVYLTFLNLIAEEIR